MDKRQNNPLQNAYARRYILQDGSEQNLKVVELNNGKIRVLLNESKGLDIMQLWHCGENISFVSKNGFTARETPFLNRFEGGMMYTCGLDSVGGRQGFELHGTYHNIPARILCINETEDEISVTAQIHYSALFGQNLVMERCVVLSTKDATITVNDTLKNLGTKDENYCILYHINFGYPFLDEGVEIVCDTEKVEARAEYARKFLPTSHIFEKPQDNDSERCYYLYNKGDNVKVINKKLAKKVTISYSKDTLPALVQWNSPVTTDYALGIEPASTFLDDDFKYSLIKAGENVKFMIKLDIEKV